LSNLVIERHNAGDAGFNYQITKLSNYEMNQGLCRKKTAEKSRDKESGKHEGSGISKKDL